MKPVVLKLNKEFKRLYYQGKFQSHSLLVTYCRKNQLGINRIGITTGKKVGNAVCRSRSRRVIRAAWREIAGEIPVGYDFVFVARAQTPSAKSTRISHVMKGQILTILEGFSKPRSKK